jgi:UDP-glucose-4-epimerase GalE
MRVLVTGGGGYIGSHAARALAQKGHEVFIVDNLSTGHRYLARGFQLVEADIADANRLRPILSNVDAVMHFAAHAYVGESILDPAKYFHNNVRKGLAFLDAVVQARVPYFIFSSSCAIYGVPSTIPITERTLRDPVNPYGITKLAFERALESYGPAYGLRSVSLRYFNAAGADDSGDIGEDHTPETHLIPLVLEAATGRRVLDIFGDDYPTSDGTCIRDYIHVCDLADAHVKALEYLVSGGKNVAMNLGTGTGYSVRNVIDAVERVTGRVVPCKVGPRRPGDPPELVADVTLARELLDWHAKRDLSNMIETAWKWCSSNRMVLAQTT